MKHGEVRKTDSREIQDIVTNRSIMELPKATGKQRISMASINEAAHKTAAVRKPRSKMTLEWPGASLDGSPGRSSASIEKTAWRNSTSKNKGQQVEAKDQGSAADKVARRLPVLKLISPFGEDLSQPYFNHRQTASHISAILNDGFQGRLSERQQQRAQVEHHRTL